MRILYINAAFREDSRTAKLAEHYLQLCKGEIKRLNLGEDYPAPLDAARLAIYNQSVAAHDFSHQMFDTAKEFVQADEIVIAAPFWNYSIPAALHAYLEMVCSQGVSFDIDEKGVYHSLCRAKKLTFIMTSGGFIPEKNHAFGYIEDLVEVFWKIPEVHYYKAEGVDVYGTDVEALLAAVCAQMDEEEA